MSNYIFYINESEIANGDKCFDEGKYEEAEMSFQSALDTLYSYDGDQLYPLLLAADLKEKIQFCRWHIRDSKDLHSHLGCVLYHIQRFDIEMVAELLQDNITYMDYDKDVFIDKLNAALNVFKQKGDTYLDRMSGHCSSKKCNYKKSGFSFIGNKSNLYLDLIFEIENDLISDIFECNDFKCSQMCFDRKLRVTIDQVDYPF
jgi:hypothetical protein